MSWISHWNALSGTVLVINKKEVTEFLRKYVSVNFKAGKEPDEQDMKKLNDMFDKNGYNEMPFFYSTCREQMILSFPTLESCVKADFRNMEDMEKYIFTSMLYDEDECSGGTLYKFSDKNGKYASVDSGDLLFFTDKSTRPQDILTGKSYKSTEEIVEEFQDKMAAYLPEDFDWDSHIGFFQCATYA